MDYKTKEDYRNKIKEISKKTKISEMYIAQKLLELAIEAKSNSDENNCNTEIITEKIKKTHIGYYLFGKNVNLLYKKLQYNEEKAISPNKKTKIYIYFVYILTVIVAGVIASKYPQNSHNMWINVISFLLLIIPISELVIQITQYILSKFVKPKLIPKMDFYNGIPKDEATFVVIPTIVSSKEKVKEMYCVI